MNDAPFEPSRRSRREARTAVDTPSPQELFASADDRDQAVSASDRVDAARENVRRGDVSRRSEGAATSGFFGGWKPLAAAGGALVVAVAVGLIAGVAFDGATGRSVGSVLAALVVGVTGLSLMARVRPPRFFAVRGLDVLWALVAGGLLPFVTGIAARSLGFPALGALSPRWLLLGVAAPFVVMLMLTFFAIAFVYPAALMWASTRFTPVVSRVIAGAVSSVAFAVIPIVFAGTVSGMPMALFLGFGISASVFVALSGACGDLCS